MQIWRFIAGIICLSLFLTSCGRLGMSPFEEGIWRFKVQDYRSAFVRLKPEAIRGQPDAMYAVGYMYYYGQGVVENRKKAWYWIENAAKRGQPDAIVAMKILTMPKLPNRETRTNRLKKENY